MRLEIVSVGINAPIEPVGLKGDRALGWATSDMAVGWYSEGFRPGGRGNAVLVGHLRTHADGSPGSLWRLDEVKPGSEVIITMNDGELLRYQATATEKFDVLDRPLARIFGKVDTENLNIITHSYVDEQSMRRMSVAVFSSRAVYPSASTGLSGPIYAVSPAFRSDMQRDAIPE